MYQRGCGQWGSSPQGILLWRTLPGRGQPCLALGVEKKMARCNRELRASGQCPGRRVRDLGGKVLETQTKSSGSEPWGWHVAVGTSIWLCVMFKHTSECTKGWHQPAQETPWPGRSATPRAAGGPRSPDSRLPSPTTSAAPECLTISPSPVLSFPRAPSSRRSPGGTLSVLATLAWFS